GGKAIERQVFEAYVIEKLQALRDLGEDLARDSCFFRRELQLGKKSGCLGDVQACYIGDGPALGNRSVTFAAQNGGGASQADVERFFAETRTVAIRAARVAAVTAEKYAHVDLILLRFEIVEVLADAIELRLAVAFEDEALLGFGEI